MGTENLLNYNTNLFEEQNENVKRDGVLTQDGNPQSNISMRTMVSCCFFVETFFHVRIKGIHIFNRVFEIALKSTKT